jgi:hypothetical protein
MPIASTVVNIEAFKPTLATVAEDVLRDAGQPLPLKKIVEGVRSTWHWKNRSPKSIRASLTPTLRRRTDVFDSPKRGFYGLQSWKVKKVG